MVFSFGNYVHFLLPDGLFRDLMVDGIIAGIGGIVIFLPQIILLMLFMTILEDTGYMARVAFMDSRTGPYLFDCFTAGYFNTTSVVDAVQFKMESGNMDGEIKMYGISTT